jgi:hypothetical protein
VLKVSVIVRVIPVSVFVSVSVFVVSSVLTSSLCSFLFTAFLKVPQLDMNIAIANAKKSQKNALK